MSKPIRERERSREDPSIASRAELRHLSPARGLSWAAVGLTLSAVIGPIFFPEGLSDREGTQAGSLTSSTTSGPSPVPSTGSGNLRVLSVPGEDSPRVGRRVSYSVEVEEGADADADGFSTLVREVLTDHRGWEPQDSVHFVSLGPEQLRSGERPQVRITLASPSTVDRMCAPLRTEGQVSCRNGDRVALNARRWRQGAPSYPDDLLHYRIYLINHEVGHALGHGHEPCSAPGSPAPVMLQQTLGLDGCVRYPWPVTGQDP
ncbi:Protein of unknown function [Austwickia chelonae]|uniref:DUF3152 domain-containing protein n=1 Tax=Austwickia chelonae NBRC 105200 TaxID=1184607 RepID=K6VMH3_9MICO|nr:DUF3152 domain-containing protein [Austwickia chelonae]GAB76555.1 hypothetical protein AUCHE_01_01170 [Austwickia chelonae NBRC 105200]SEW26751.1 Protein of unknown function [Austwickia chelonae]